MNGSIICAIDVGTTKVCTLIAQMQPDGSLSTLGYSTVPSRGLRKGIIVDIEETTTAISESLSRAERMAGVKISHAISGITGHHIHSVNCRTSISIHGEDDVISEEHVNRLINEVRVLTPAPEDSEILHIIARQFILDGLSGVKNPVGMHGRKLSVDAHVVFVRSSFMRNLVECLRRVGIEHVELVLEPIAAAEAVLTETEKQLGVALLDIGGGTTDIAIFTNGSIAYSRALPVGGNHVTQDLSIGLRTPFHEAESLKLQHGCAIENKIPKDEVIEVLDIGMSEKRLLPKRVVGQIIEPRMRELLELAYMAMSESGLVENLASGVVITGGGALLKGTDELAKEIIGLPTRLGIPKAPMELSEPLQSPIYATSIGLLLYGAKLLREEKVEVEEKPLWKRFLNTINTLLRKAKEALK